MTQGVLCLQTIYLYFKCLKLYAYLTQKLVFHIKENKYYNSVVICLTAERKIYFYKATAYGIVPVQKSIQQQSVQFTTWSCSSSHAYDHHVQRVHKHVYAEIQDYTTMPKTQLATAHPRSNVENSVLSPISLQLQVLGTPRDQGRHSQACSITSHEPVQGVLF